MGPKKSDIGSVPFNLTLETPFLVSKKTADRTRNLLDPDESTDGTENLWKTPNKSESYLK